ncbi:hypothetical protein K2P97_06155 [bacterium]|nr:hypothetical protein [bacterium]
MKTLILFTFLSTILQTRAADICDGCKPLTEVSITNAGLEKILSQSIDQNLKALDEEVIKRAGFRDLKMDRSHCKPKKVSDIWNKKPEELDCFGLPQFGETGSVSGDTPLRPFVAGIDNIKLKKLDLELAAPVKCKNFVCDFEIKTNELEIEGDMHVTYSDNKEVFMPPTKMKLSATDKSDIRFFGQAHIDPKSGKLNDLVHIKEDQSKIKITPGSLRVDMDFGKPFASEAEAARVTARNFHRYVPVDKIDAKYINQQYEAAIWKYELEIEREIERERSAAGKPALHWTAARAEAKKRVAALIKEAYGSPQGFKATLATIKWPPKDDDKATYEFMQNPPKELALFPEIVQKMQFVQIAAAGEKAGFQNASAFMYSAFAVQMANQAADTEIGMDWFIKPMIEKEVLPAVHQQVNNEMRNLKTYWNQISKIPNLKMQNLQVLSDLQEKLKTAEGPKEKARIQREIDILKRKMESDWVSIDTEVAIDENTRNGSLLRAQIGTTDPKCSTVPKRFSEDTETDFDVRTEFGVNTLQEYFNRMAAKKNLNMCVGSDTPATCAGGTKVELKKPPKISCSNGEFVVDIDAEATKAIFNVDIQGQVRAKVANCKGSPCIQFTDAKGNFKNVFIDTFFGHMLDRGISTAMAKNNTVPVQLPKMDLKKAQTSKQDCNTKLDWSINTPTETKP